MIWDSIFPVIVKYKFTILFYSLIVFLIYINRKRLDFHGKFVALYRTQIGINFMNYMAGKGKGFFKFLGYAGIFVGYAGMIFTLILIFILTYNLVLDVPGSSGASPVIPGLPIAGTGLIFPLITGWIALFIIMCVHEFAHGVIAVVHNIRVKSSGIAFFGPILGAFVEPDEKRLTKQKGSIQNSVFAAGSFSNLLLVVVISIIAALIFAPLVNSMVFSEGVVISPQSGLPAEKAGITNGTVITKINGIDIRSPKDFEKIINDVSVNETINLSSKNQTFFVTTTEHPEKEGKSYLGVWVHGSKTKLKNENIFTRAVFEVIMWLLTLMGWVAFLSLNIGLINLLPIFITDGARMLKVALDRFFNKKLSLAIWSNINWLCVMLLLILLFLPLLRWISSNLTVLLVNLFI
ncbi:site-2 protease family protein [Candidatus Woesearchaeota archaeon]|nr:site-2 protease family protein [Candidatus Woesearchaeota archaeon]